MASTVAAAGTLAGKRDRVFLALDPPHHRHGEGAESTVYQRERWWPLHALAIPGVALMYSPFGARIETMKPIAIALFGLSLVAIFSAKAARGFLE